MITNHKFTQYELNLILMALEMVTLDNAFDSDDEQTAQELMNRLPKEAKEQINEVHNV